jgi:hypothetical protein
MFHPAAGPVLVEQAAAYLSAYAYGREQKAAGRTVRVVVLQPMRRLPAEQLASRRVLGERWAVAVRDGMVA